MRKNTAILIVVAMLITMASGFLTPAIANEATTIKLGDKIQFGSYMGEKLIWTVIDLDDSGNPMLFADNILNCKVFDVPAEKETTYRYNFAGDTGEFPQYAHANWGTSTLRAWLNSDAADASTINFPSGINPYLLEDGKFAYWKNESGFLSTKNFTSGESSLIKPVINKNLLTDYEEPGKNKTGGSKSNTIPAPIESYKANAAADSLKDVYYNEAEDKVFLLSTEEYITAHDVMGDDIIKAKFLKPDDNSKYTLDYFLRDSTVRWLEVIPFTLTAPLVTDGSLVFPDMFVNDKNVGAYACKSWDDLGLAQTGNYVTKDYTATGVRPACWIDASKIKSLGGLGITTYPYVINGTPAQTIKGAAKVSINGNDVKFNTASGAPFIDKANRTQVPLRVTMESYRATVGWDSATKTATVEKNGIKVEVPVGKNYIVVNGQNQTIDTTAQIVNGKTYLPIKSVVVALGGEVS